MQMKFFASTTMLVILVSEVQTDEDFHELITSWNLPASVVVYLATKHINIEVLRCMEYPDIDDLFKDHNLFYYKILFKAKLINWRNETVSISNISIKL